MCQPKKTMLKKRATPHIIPKDSPIPSRRPRLARPNGLDSTERLTARSNASKSPPWTAVTTLSRRPRQYGLLPRLSRRPRLYGRRSPVPSRPPRLALPNGLDSTERLTARSNASKSAPWTAVTTLSRRPRQYGLLPRLSPRRRQYGRYHNWRQQITPAYTARGGTRQSVRPTRDYPRHSSSGANIRRDRG